MGARGRRRVSVLMRRDECEADNDRYDVFGEEFGSDDVVMEGEESIRVSERRNSTGSESC